MLKPGDGAVAVGETKSARIGARVQPSVRDAIGRAAALSGVGVGSFVADAAYNAAQATIEAREIVALESEADRAAFLGALENPPKPNSRLRQAFALREKLIANAG